ncbi:MAG: MarR family winged helix-turn-helix transcriptional regulator [Alkalilacustris sp.]
MSRASDLAAELLIHVARLAQSGGDHRLTPAQWTALRFFARANRLSRTPSAFSAFHATTRGTASQTVKALVAAGLLERHRHDDDGRSIRFELTPAGLAALEDDPLRALAARIEELPSHQRGDLLQALKALTGALATDQEAPRFGTCADCTHCDPRDHQTGAAFCRCAEATLLAGDMDALCVAFAPRPPG